MDEPFPNFRLGFTRGYISSQAYAERFDNAPIEPDQPTIDFDSKPFELRYRWLGFHARRLVSDLLEETLPDPSSTLAASPSTLNKPDVTGTLEHLAGRPRLS